MKYLRKFFFLREIYFRQTLTQILYIYGTFGILASSFIFGLTASGAYEPDITLYYVSAVYCYLLLRTLLRSYIVQMRLGASGPSAISKQSGELIDASINFELNNIDAVREIATYSNGKLYDVVFNFYQQTKHGEYLSKEAYYTVFEAKLSRPLPHLMFDSAKAKSKQFKHIYVKSQRISVQGGFDEYFDTYTPETYHIDSLSFITPEVMEAMILAKDYDIEIIGDRLLIYAPLIGLAQANDMANLGVKLANEIDDNIDNYHDNRLKGAARKTTVAPFGRIMLKSSYRYILASSLSAAVMVSWAIANLVIHLPVITDLYILLIVIFVGNLYKAFKLRRENDRIRESYYYLYNTDRGRPLNEVQTRFRR